VVNQPVLFEKYAKMGNAIFENQVVTKIKLRHYAYIFVRRVKMIEEAKITFNFISNYEFHNGLRNPGLSSLISHKSAAADEKRTLVGNDTTSGSFTVDNHTSVALQYKQVKKPPNIKSMELDKINFLNTSK